VARRQCRPLVLCAERCGGADAESAPSHHLDRVRLRERHHVPSQRPALDTRFGGVGSQAAGNAPTPPPVLISAVVGQCTVDARNRASSPSSSRRRIRRTLSGRSGHTLASAVRHRTS
jgi:hypothetical protein